LASLTGGMLRCLEWRLVRVFVAGDRLPCLPCTSHASCLLGEHS